MRPLLIAGLALAGLAIGWWLRSVVFARAVPPDEPPRRSCPGCGHLVRPPARGPLRPVLTPAGRCPGCRERLGPPPLAIELAMAAALGALAARIHPGLVLAAACWLAVCAVPLGWIDVAVHRLPDVLTAAAYAGTAAFLLLAAAASGHWPSLGRAVLGGLLLAACYLVLALISPSGMGAGDVKLAASLGTALAWFGWSTLLAGAAAGFLLGGAYGVILLATRRVSRGQLIPFGPFMIAGTFLAIIAGAAL